MIDAAFPARRVEWERAAASTEALAQLTASQSHFCRRQIVQAVALVEQRVPPVPFAFRLR